MRYVVRSLALVGALCTGTGTAQAQIVNGSFETGDYTGWTLFEGSPGPSFSTWGIAANGQTINPGDLVFDFFDNTFVSTFSPGLPITYSATDGNFLAVQLQLGSQTHHMFQDVALPPGATSLLWDMQYTSHNGFFVPMLQELRVTIRNPANDAVLATLFATTQGTDPQSIPMTSFSGDISAFAGSTVRISVDMNVDAAFDNFQLLGEKDCSAFPCGNGNVLICHVPPGEPGNEETLCISPEAVPAHLEDHPGDHCGPCCPWDCDDNDDGNGDDGDGIVNVADLLALLGQYDPMSPDNCTGGSCDFDGDGCVDVRDLLKLLAHFDPAGVGCPQ